MIQLKAQDLACIKRDKLLFNNLALKVEEGEMLVIAGPNGAGKTSLLRILAGLSSPEAGEIHWGTKAIDDDESDYKSALIYIGHKLGFSINLTALENLRFWMQQREQPVNDDVIIDVLDDLALVGMEDVLVRQMSAGQQRRVALARLWLTPAKIWILDEPLTALDKFGIKLLQARMLAHIKRGGMIISTSHQQFAEDIPVRVLELEPS
ncbi:cytochrome c biogenesis heme-transporting ATPase CcmA [Alteromonas sp. a30]|uniref:cytochrome c biogenesis heme-transporting ATPase CcmA n=1 Tax=Alteromonas sp. a30 TaxID=2730917 RepID=UPI00227FFAFB|nr:cytochrome c biogenesis heme-transporting ATPase CcmA [Alteromonas sp. a30]MCY7294405.1 cytochrome c biogenesis heme-transporting ATPase CcmA [Alteromonas sp. a30]